MSFLLSGKTEAGYEDVFGGSCNERKRTYFSLIKCKRIFFVIWLISKTGSKLFWDIPEIVLRAEISLNRPDRNTAISKMVGFVGK